MLTNDGRLQQRITDPKFKLPKTYWVQVEGQPEPETLKVLRNGVELKDGTTRPAKAQQIEQPKVWRREPPVIDHRDKNSSWLQLTIQEGKNRQVRRMCAAVGHPVLRLVRAKVGQWSLRGLEPGHLETMNIHLPKS